MANILKDAIAEAARLPESDQERIGTELLAHIEKLRALRADLASGIRSLDEGRGKALEIDDVIARARKNHGRA
jgi:hypothetical protein